MNWQSSSFGVVVPDALLITVLCLALTQVIALTVYLVKKLVQFERLEEKVRNLTAKIERKKKS